MSHPYYYLNMCGVRLDDTKLNTIPAPRFELTTHITLKTSQAFGLLGAGAVAPLASLVQGKNDLASIQNKAFHYGKNGILAGLIIGPLVSAAFVTGKSLDGIQDRCFRIRLNRGQVRADQFSILGLAVGLGAAHFTNVALDQGAVFGYVGGFLCGTILHQLLH